MFIMSEESIEIKNLDEICDSEAQLVNKIKAHGKDWIFRTFEKKLCVSFIPIESDSRMCKCGRVKNVHMITETDVVDGICMSKEKTNAYGSIEFQGPGKKTRAKYIRLSDDTPPVDVLKLLLKEWNLESPKLLISVTGGAKSFKLNPKLKTLFTAGISKIANATSTWVITGGTHTGVMKHVGEALQVATQSQYGNNKVYCIGIATWGIITERKSLVNTFSTPVAYHVKNTSAKTACLDNNHTHFLLVDNGNVRNYGGEIKFRGNFEKCIREMKIDINRCQSGVPGVQLVLEGGPNTVKTVLEAVNQEPPLPVVVIKDSGRAADLIAFAHGISQGEGPLYEMSDLVEHTQLMNMIEKMFPELSTEQSTEVYCDILKCVEKKNYITIFRMEDGNGDIDEAILTAFLKANYLHQSDQLNFAMLWNRDDIARSQIFVEGSKWKEEELYWNLKNALERNKPKFVELILEHNLNIGQFMTANQLEELYNIRASKSNNYLRFALGEEKCYRGTITLKDVSTVLKQLVKFPIRCLKYSSKSTYLNKHIFSRGSNNIYFKFPFTELFIWACLCNLNKMAMFFWSEGEEPLAKALFAKKLYMAMAKKAEDANLQEELIEKLKTESMVFGKMAVALLKECYTCDEKLTSQLVTHNLNEWGQQTCLSLAVSSKHLDFVAHSCCQDLLSSKWTGALHMSGSQAWKVILGMLFPPAVLLLKFRSQKDFTSMIMTEKEHKYAEYNLSNGDQLKNSEEKSMKVENYKIFENYGFHSPSLNSIKNYSTQNLSNDLSFNMESDYNKTLCWKEKFVAFYTAPVTKFWSNVVVYVLFLILFAFVIITKLPESPYNTEWILLVMIISYTTEELRQLLHSDADTFKHKLKAWATSYWNICDAIAIILFFIAFTLRMNNQIVVGQVVYSIDIMLWIIRLLDIFSVNKYLGPYVVMIWQMTLDMAYFMFILLVFLLAYGIARYAILNPNIKRSWGTIGEILFAPYFQIYGELFFEYPKENDNITLFKTENHYDHVEPIVSLIMALYLLITNVLLLNLLIAIFNNTYTKVQANSNIIWKFQRYNLVQEYANRPMLMPPLVLFAHLSMFLRYLCRRRKQDQVIDRRLKFFPTEDQLHDINLFELNCLSSYLRKRDTILLATQEEKLRIISERVDTIGVTVNEFSKETQYFNKKSNWHVEKLDERVNTLETLFRSMMLSMSDIHHHVTNQKRNKKMEKKTWQRSISEYQYGGRAEEEAKLTNRKLSSPVSLPTMPSVFVPYPRRDSSRSGAVRKAAKMFRRGSRDGDSKTILKKTVSVDPTLSPLDEIDSPLKKQRSHSLPNVNLISDPQLDDHHAHHLSRQFVETSQQVRFSGQLLEDIRSRYDTGSSTGFRSQNGSPNLSVRQDRYSPNIPRKVSYRSPNLSRTSLTASQQLHPTRMSPKAKLRKQYTREEYSSSSSDEEFFNSVGALKRYPMSSVNRLLLSDEQRDWKFEAEDYNPPSHTSMLVSQHKNCADAEITNALTSFCRFNEMDGQIDRISYTGVYEVVNGLPRNPMGRTGVCGRGLLWRYGPNHISEPLFTRWSASKLELRGRSSDTLELLVMKRKNSTSSSLPSGVRILGDILPFFITKLFSEMTLKEVGLNTEKRKSVMAGFSTLINDGLEVEKGYLQDERNTDNAWMEGIAYNYHDNTNTVLSKFLLADSCKRYNFRWVEMCGDMDLPQYQIDWAQEVAAMRGAYFG